MSDVRIKITADNQQANQALQSTQKQLAATAVAATKVDSSFDKLGKGSSQATNALTNLGRVVQDAPFGFIGIANNINPLLESFQRLKSEVGTTGGALKALVGSLAGAGGLGLAVSLGTAALSLFGMAMRGSGSETKKAKEETDKYADALREASKEVGKEAADIAVIVAQIKNEVLSREQRQAAVKKLQDLAPQYFSTLDKEKATIEQITKAYDSYAASITKAVQARVIEKQLEDVVAKRVELQRKAIEFRKQEVTEDGKLLKSRTVVFETEKKGETEYQKFRKERGVLTRNENKELQNLLLTEKALVDELSKIKPVDFKTEGAKRSAETISDVIAKLRRDINFLSEKELQLGTDETKEKIQAIEQAIERLVRDFKVNPKDTIVQKLFGEIQDLIAKLDDIRIEPIKIKTAIEVKDEIDKAAKEAKDRADKLFGNVKIKPIPINISLREGEFTQKMRAFYKMLNEMNERATEGLKSTFTNAFASIGDSIAESLQSGADFGKAIFGNLFKVLGAGLKQLGEAMIGIGTAKIALEKFKFAPGIATVVAGIATVALGALLQNALPGFADGVRGFRGGLAVVGERGPELVRLPSGSDVIPNYRMNNMAASGQQVFIPKMKLRGKDIFVSFNRTEDNYSRNGL